MNIELQDVKDMIKEIYDVKVFSEDSEDDFTDPEWILRNQEEYTSFEVSIAKMQMKYREHFKSLMQTVQDFEYKYILK
jgi:hypothetical protein